MGKYMNWWVDEGEAPILLCKSGPDKPRGTSYLVYLLYASNAQVMRMLKDLYPNNFPLAKTKALAPRAATARGPRQPGDRTATSMLVVIILFGGSVQYSNSIEFIDIDISMLIVIKLFGNRIYRYWYIDIYSNKVVR